MTGSFKEPPRRNPDPVVRTTLAEATAAVKAEEQARLAEHAKRTRQLREARMAKENCEER
jgi:hypothetical protein